jgi:hypothetical protein
MARYIPGPFVSPMLRYPEGEVVLRQEGYSSDGRPRPYVWQNMRVFSTPGWPVEHPQQARCRMHENTFEIGRLDRHGLNMSPIMPCLPPVNESFLAYKQNVYSM